MADFTPQEIEQFLQQFFDVVGARQYVGARYVPIFGRAGEDTVEWDDTAPYEPLTVVMHDGVSYVSRRYVPAGVAIADTDYWVETYRFNAQVEQYRQEVLGFQGQIDGIRYEMESDYVPFPVVPLQKYGTTGQVLSTLANGETEWADPVIPSDEQTAEAIDAWLTAHPEATTTVQDGTITTAKLADESVTWDKLADDLKDNDTLVKAMAAPSTLVQDAGKNLLMGAPFVTDYYYAGHRYESTDYVCFMVDVAVNVYYSMYGVRFVSSETATIFDIDPTSRYDNRTFTDAGTVMVSVRKTDIDGAFLGTTADYQAGLIPTRDSFRIRADKIGDGSIETAKLHDGAVSTAKLGGGSVTWGKLATDLTDNDALLKALYAPAALVEDAENNLLMNAPFVTDYYYGTSAVQSDTYVYYKVHVETDTVYTVYQARFISDGTAVLYDLDYGSIYKNITFATEEDVYITVRKVDMATAFFGTTEDYYDGAIPTRSAFTVPPAMISADTPVHPTQIEGLRIKDGTNLLVTATVLPNQYWSDSGGNNMHPEASGSYDTYVLPVEGGVHYCANCEMRFVTCTAYENPKGTASLSYTQDAMSFTTPAGARYAYISINRNLWPRPFVGRGYKMPTETAYVWPFLTNGASVYNNGFYTVKTNMPTTGRSGGYYNNLKKNNVYSFMCDITSFATLNIGHGKDAYHGSYIEIDATKVRAHDYNAYVDYTHGLTISDYLYVTLTVGDDCTASLSMTSNGQTFTQGSIAWTGDNQDVPFVQNVGGNLTNCTFTWSSADFRCPLWVFGDSYISLNDDKRWPYYLAQDGYLDDVLLNGYPGEGSAAAIQSLNDMTEYYGTPKQALWALGMNDGGDSGATPSATWLENVETFIDVCEDYGIEPILATIPTVPGINHEAKNTWVRNSGRRYVDFARAVGADGTGSWFTGMLSSDDVHPTALGAVALYHMALVQLPEITYPRP